MEKRIKLFTDGASRGNPGPGGIGIRIYDKKRNVLEEVSRCIGYVTNNQAEYQALIEGLKLSAKYTRGSLKCYMDSELVVRQMNGQYQISSPHLRNLFCEAKKLEKAFTKVTYRHLRRTHSKIQEVDRLSKEAYVK